MLKPTLPDRSNGIRGNLAAEINVPDLRTDMLRKWRDIQPLRSDHLHRKPPPCTRRLWLSVRAAQATGNFVGRLDDRE